MTHRNPILATGEIYHVFNRSSANEEIFLDKRELSRALDLLDYYRFPQELKYSKFKILSDQAREEYFSQIKKTGALVEIFAYALMPNHHHILLKQLKKEGIRNFISNFQNSFAKYFNTKNERHGSLFQNPFKAKRIERDEVFTHVSRYIHLNPVTSFLIKPEELVTSSLTSYPYYLGIKSKGFVSTQFLLKMLGSEGKFAKFVMDQVDYQRRLHLIKSLTFE